MTVNSDIDAFWRWFADNSSRISDDSLSESVVEELDRRVSGLGCPAWEIGPGDKTGWFLALSPDGDPESLPLTEYIVDRAPTIPAWEFLPHRPKKKWDLRFEIENETGPIDVDARGWTYVAYRYPDGMHDLVVNVGSDTGLRTDDRAVAVRIAVEGQIGEAAIIRDINEIEAVSEWSAADAAHSQPLTSLGRPETAPDAE